jgi:hypothetical protein
MVVVLLILVEDADGIRIRIDDCKAMQRSRTRIGVGRCR